MLSWNHCSPTCKFSFIYNHELGKPQINDLCLSGLWGLSHSYIMPSFITEKTVGNKQVQMLVDPALNEWIKNESLRLRQFKNILRLWSFGEAEPLQRRRTCCMLDVILLVYLIVFLGGVSILTKNEETLTAGGESLLTTSINKWWGICFENHSVSASS